MQKSRPVHSMNNSQRDGEREAYNSQCDLLSNVMFPNNREKIFYKAACCISVTELYPSLLAITYTADLGTDRSDVQKAATESPI